ncbi:MAG: hypothetical protein J5892_03890 [Bacilli bacterium]|nr:hypothetical protein [Bacilli bacterium]
MEERNENSNIVFLLLAIVFIILTLVILIGAYGIYLNQPANFFKTTINNKYLLFNQKKEKAFNYNPAEYSINAKTSVKLNTNIKSFEDINNSFKLVLNSDVKHKYMDSTISIGKKDTSIVIDEDKAYIDSKDIYEKPLLLNNELNIKWDNLKNINEADFDLITKTIKEEIIKSMDKKQFKTTKTTIKIDGKDIKAKKISYTDKNTNKTLKKIIDNLIDNDEFIKSVANITNTDKKAVIDYLKSYKNDIDLESITINFYTTGLFSKLAKMEIEYEALTISYTNYKDTNYELKITDDENEILFNADLNSDNEYVFKLKYNDTTILKGKVTEHTDKVIKINFELTLNEETYPGKIVINTNKDNANEIDKDLKITIYTDETKKNYLEANINTSITKEKIKQKDMKNAEDINKLKTKNRKQIENKIKDRIDDLTNFSDFI